MSQEAAAGAEDAATTTEDTAATQDDSSFDAERAMNTIKAQRESENKLKAQVKELQEQLEGYTKAEADKAEAEKALEVKVSERDAVIESLRSDIAALHVQHDFEAKAAGKGLNDPALAYLAAKQEGLLGAYDPKAGTVGEHDWEALGERYPSFQTVTSEASTGDAGARGRGKVTTTSTQFNQAVRGAIRR